ncbi:MAG: SpoIIE family protein phosphatase [Bacteroidota bacterium]
MAQHLATKFPGIAMEFQVGDFLYMLNVVGFFMVNAVLIGRLFGHIEKLHVTTLLWRLFLIGMIGITVIMLITFANKATLRFTTYPYLTAIYYSLGFYVLTIFFLCAVFMFRRFIFYPRTRRKLLLWRIFLGFLGLSLIYTFSNASFSLAYLIVISYIPFFILCLFLAANVRWIAYLNFNQKLRALGLFVLLMIVVITYVIAGLRLPVQLAVPLLNSMIFLHYIVIFTLTYCTASILVLFFNLPTSSIFEIQGLEIASFSKINQAIQSNLENSDIMNTLLNAGMLASNASAGWIELMSEEEGRPKVSIHKKISLQEIRELKAAHNPTGQIMETQLPFQIKNLRLHKSYRHVETKFRSLMGVPILSSSQTFGVVYVVNEVVNSFEDVAVSSITSFAEQAGIGLENAQLVRKSIEMERYQEQLKIAQEVQRELLPQNLPYSEGLDFGAVCETAYEVGGDYFDLAQPKEQLFRIAIGDVSGKGTTAAFYMAEIKGIFHALTQLELSVKEFVAAANQALSACLQKGFFVTLSYLQIDLKQRSVEIIRAGHSPAFYYHANCNEIKMLREGTLGLGIVRSGNFSQYIKDSTKIEYQSGDIMALYTDGIVEARNEEKEEYGYDRFQEIIQQNLQEPAQEIADRIVQSVKDFTHGEMSDDYTVLIIKFK